MKIGFIGLGKLGLPISVAIAEKGYEVFGYDVDIKKRFSYRSSEANLCEPDIDNRLQRALNSHLHIVDSIKEVVERSEIVFVAVQTPSKPDNNFDTSYLIDAVKEIGRESQNVQKRLVVAIISTVLPRTMRTEVAPALQRASRKIIGKNIGLCYNAFFIAMGTVIEDFYHPEFILIGESDSESGHILEEFYELIVAKNVPKLHMTWENAEIVKMAYNTMIGFKIIYANTLMEMCHKIPTADINVVYNALSKAHLRITSPSYLRGGMGDGGPCHPRDNLALSWLSEKLPLSTNPFHYIMEARKAQTEWLANLAISYDLPIVIMGIRYKANTNLTDSSASLLLKDILLEKGHKPFIYDPMANYTDKPPQEPSVFIIAVDEPCMKDYPFPEGSVIIDPWRCLNPTKLRGLNYVPVGRA